MNVGIIDSVELCGGNWYIECGELYGRNIFMYISVWIFMIMDKK